MRRDFFVSLETCSTETQLPVDEVLQQLAFNDQGLIPVITQDAHSHQVLMHAWMNLEALTATLTTQRMTYWSRSRQSLWKKGETSGHFQTLVDMSIDCDGDTILCRVNQTGPACHTGRPSCFYLAVDPDSKTVIVDGANR